MYHILLSDDIAVFRKQIKRFPFWASNNEFSLSFEASDGVSALEIMQKEKVDILITDIQMPKMDGLTLLQSVKEQGLCDCIILLSEYTEFEYARQGLVLGAFDYIVKPITSDKLSDVLFRCRDLLQEKQAKEPLSQEYASVISALIQQETSLEKNIDYLLEQLMKYCNYNSAQATLMLSDFLSSVYQSSFNSYPWIKKIYRSCLSAQNMLSAKQDFSSASNFFTNTLLELQQLFIYYQNLNSSDLISQAREYVFKSINKKITLTEAADYCFVSKSYLSHTFKQETGISLIDYATKFKMDIAKKMLMESDLRIFEIAALLGYDDAKYFGKIFKNYCHVTPAEFKSASASS